MIRLLQLYPEHLDLNGDSGNLIVLQQRAIWGGLDVELNVLKPGQSVSARPDVILIGHGSTAAWKQIYGEFARLAPTLEAWLSEGTQVLAVASGFAALHGLFDNLEKSVERGERKSIFVADDFEGKRIYGYLNSDLQLPNIFRMGNLVGTMLHGPLLAKNSWLADEMIEKALGETKRLQIDINKLDSVELLAVAASDLAEQQAKA